jgi:hypothetical protein
VNLLDLGASCCEQEDKRIARIVELKSKFLIIDQIFYGKTKLAQVIVFTNAGKLNMFSDLWISPSFNNIFVFTVLCNCVRTGIDA